MGTGIYYSRGGQMKYRICVNEKGDFKVQTKVLFRKWVDTDNAPKYGVKWTPIVEFNARTRKAKIVGG